MNEILEYWKKRCLAAEELIMISPKEDGWAIGQEDSFIKWDQIKNEIAEQIKITEGVSIRKKLIIEYIEITKDLDIAQKTFEERQNMALFGGWRVTNAESDDFASGLSYGEMLELLVAMTATFKSPCLLWMRSLKDHQEYLNSIEGPYPIPYPIPIPIPIYNEYDKEGDQND